MHILSKHTKAASWSDPEQPELAGVSSRGVCLQGPASCTLCVARTELTLNPSSLVRGAHRSSLLFYLRCYDNCNKEQSAHLHGERHTAQQGCRAQEPLKRPSKWWRSTVTVRHPSLKRQAG
ncbi:unnamed protein product [Boreogadus saida]